MNETKSVSDQVCEYLIFTIDSTDFGVDIRLVEEIIEIQQFFGIPNSMEFCKGIINIRGTIVPVIDMRLKLGFKGVEYSDRACIIVVMLGLEKVGMLVDKVQEVIRISAEELCDPPLDMYKGYTDKIICAKDKVNQVLDMKAVFDASGDIFAGI
ncbi:MAG: purine-binding chemotaxis protein CheW [Clostridia bacterium]|nr:purine-binding chemotaxis protein CheW [Clostridia bacterium]